MSGSRYARWALGLAIVGYLFVFFVPLLPFTATVTCTAPTGGENYYGCGPIPNGSYTGFSSIGRSLTGWGAYYAAWATGYTPPLVQLGTSTLTAFGELLFVVGPLALCLAALLTPEILDGVYLVSDRLRAGGRE